jgi:predicted alpha/beta superfamily hydrolase
VVNSLRLEPRPILPRGWDRFEAQAEGLGRYTIDVSFPPTASPGQALPLILAVDGNLIFDVLRSVVHGDLATVARCFPPSLVVGVGYPQDEGFASFYGRRTFDFHDPWPMDDPMGVRLTEIFRSLCAAEGRSDLTIRAGGYAHFMRFLREGLLPALASRYPVDPAGRHTLLGHSGGGRFVLRALYDPSSPFRRYVALSPDLGADEAGLVAAEAAYASEHDDLDADAFTCAGEQEVGATADFAICRFGSGVMWTAERFAIRGWPSARLGWEIMSNEDHTSILPRGVSAGLRAVHRLRPGVHTAEVAEAGSRFAASYGLSHD